MYSDSTQLKGFVVTNFAKFFIQLFSSATIEREKARLLSCSLPNSGDWLSAVPLKGLGLSLFAAEFRVALCFRLGIPPLSEESSCPKCSKSYDVFGDHALACSSSDRIHRHDRLRDTIYNLASKTAFSPVLEKAHLTESRSHPGDVFLPCWSHGRHAALDVTVINSLQPAILSHAGTSAGYEHEISDERMIVKHNSACNEVGVTFIPQYAEALGGWSPLATMNPCPCRHYGFLPLRQP